MVNFIPAFKKESDLKKVKTETVADYMTTEPITFTPEQDIQEVIDTLIDDKISDVPVVDEKQELVGIVSEKVCLQVILDDGYHNLLPKSGKVSNYMSKKVVTVEDTMDVAHAANEFLKSDVRRYPVVRNGRMVGLISRKDILRATKKIKKTSW